ncbi:DUF4376 domain-containing protein [Pleomorphomonas carboxyditropha]|uniref:DUF4376 domain-containing protein n=1 Tax=Pleomorphomonas carboxyditropha TaxID=2023338 RepID=A0A2G9WNP3_9HYPH|nr:DUF4376 domain-containing protein [Pleomorphomonas carboxyditropha]PIO96303.1 hypothetical protein CJ014_26060 [Pleomorphomonas carboxyditropha]
MKTAYIVDAGVVVNSIVIADDANPIAFGALLGPEGVGVGIGWTFNGMEWALPVEPDATLDDLRAAKIAVITAAADALLSAGAPVDSGLHVALDDGSRADLTAMAATATAASAGAVVWLDSYARGWIAIENVRIPLATPAAGLALAAAVGDYYAAIVQRRRDLKDMALSAEDAAALDAVDITAGWPAASIGGT